jgi:hypothetical protein
MPTIAHILYIPGVLLVAGPGQLTEAATIAADDFIVVIAIRHESEQ